MRRLVILCTPLALVACDKGVDLSNASIEQVSAATKGVQKQQPGRWETTTELEKMDLGPMAANPGMAEVMKQQIGQQQVTTTCLTAEQAKAPGLGELSQLNSASCTFDRFHMGRGELEAAMTCGRPGGTLKVSQTGTYTATNFDLRSTVSQGVTGQPTTSMTMHVVGRRIGECKG